MHNAGNGGKKGIISPENETRVNVSVTLVSERRAMSPTSPDQPLAKRPYNESVSLSVVGLGGIVTLDASQEHANELVAWGFDQGINYFDVAPSYGNGEAEVKLGNALKPYRERAFLACKTTRRDAAGSRKELERSLRRLHTDRFDLYQFHAVTTLTDVEEIFGAGGAAETFLKAHQEGLIRHIGFSAHSEEAALAMMGRFQFDSILFPVNAVCYAQGRFGPAVIKRAQEKGIARLALKALAKGPWPEHEPRDYPKCWYKPTDEPSFAERALRFTLSEPVTAALPPGDERLFRLAVNIARSFSPMGEAEKQELLAETAGMRPLFPL